MLRALCIVAVLALACVMIRASRVGLANDYVDPVSKILAQDEALYAHSAIQMATRGGWSTPMFLGRYGLYKPPLLMWISGFSARLLGISRISLRLPVAILCAIAVGLVFLWGAELRSWQAGALAAVLVVSNHLWHVLAGMCMTDGVLVACYTAALYFLYSDPWLESTLGLWGFSGSVAAAILTKSVAGILPLGILAVYWLIAPPKFRPRFWRACLAAALPVAIASPWFIYQLLVHYRWFWMEHIRLEILGFGMGAPPQTSNEPQGWFYVKRLFTLDPVLTAMAAVALPGFAKLAWKRSAPAVLLLSWLVVMAAAVCLWQYRNASYLLPLVPALALLAGAYGPSAGRSVNWLLALAGIAFAAKVATPDAPWGLAFRQGDAVPAEAALSNHCAMSRSNELVVAGFEDALYTSVLPLPKVHYATVGGSASAGEYGMPFVDLGIAVDTAHFNDLDRWLPIYRKHLHAWGLDSVEPVATLIVATTTAELAAAIQAHPDIDFFLPDGYRSAVASVTAASHILVEEGDHFFLLARQSHRRTAPPLWTCRL